MKSPYALAKKDKKRALYHTVSIPMDLVTLVDTWAQAETKSAGIEFRSRRDTVIRIIRTVVQPKEETK